MAASQAFLYLPGLAEEKLQQLWTDPEPLTVERVEFPPTGGSSDLLLAIPYLPDMDEVIVTEAELQLRAESHRIDLDVTEYTATTNPDGSVTITLQQPAALVGVVVESDDTIFRQGENDHLVVSTAEPGRPSAPILSSPDFTPPSPMYPRPLTGLSVSTIPGGAALSFAPLEGTSWTIVVGDGDGPDTLSPRATIALRVRSVTVDQAPRALRLVIPADPVTGGTETTLYANPDVLLPAAGVQQIGFVPLAQRQLAARLEAARGASPGVTLPIPLRLASDSGGEVGLVSRSLAARYAVHPLPADPFALRVGGVWSAVPLSAPAGRRPLGCEATLVATHLGRRLDPGSAPPPLADPSDGVTVTTDRWAASALQFGTDGDTGPIELASLRLFAAADAPVEVVVEVRRDGSGLPGELLTSIVRQLPAGPGAWLEFELPAPLAIAARATLWCAVRTNDAPLRWFGSGDGAGPLWSTDRGEGWGSLAAPLGPAKPALLQLYRRVPPERAGDPPPRLDLYLGTAPVAQIDLQRADAATMEFRGPMALPAGVLSAMAGGHGPGRRPTDLRLYSASVMDVQIRGLSCTYDPFAT